MSPRALYEMPIDWAELARCADDSRANTLHLADMWFVCADGTQAGAHQAARLSAIDEIKRLVTLDRRIGTAWLRATLSLRPSDRSRADEARLRAELAALEEWCVTWTDLTVYACIANEGPYWRMRRPDFHLRRRASST